jgi:hypothetical protein
MKRILVNALAVIGAFTVVGMLLRVIITAAAGRDHVVVTGPDDKPLAHVPVFLDRGSMAIERFETDSSGRLRFDLSGRELEHAAWLICAPGAIPMVGMREDAQAGPTTYGYTRLSDSTYGWYRARGWRGPIPRECPQGTDSLGWRYPAWSGKAKDAITYTEPVWTR